MAWCLFYFRAGTNLLAPTYILQFFSEELSHLEKVGSQPNCMVFKMFQVILEIGTLTLGSKVKFSISTYQP